MSIVIRMSHPGVSSFYTLAIKPALEMGLEFWTIITLHHLKWETHESLGFKNIKTVPLGDLNIFTGFRSGKVEEIRINNEFMKDDVYYEDDPVVIKYHSK